jgi:transposase
VASRFGQDILRGDLFVFFNRRRTQVRVLFWDRTGYCIVTARRSGDPAPLAVV